MQREGRVSHMMIGKVLCVIMFVMLIATAVWAENEGGRRTLGFFDILMLPRVWMAIIFSLIGLVLLTKSWVTRNVRLISVTVIFFVFAVLTLLPLGNFARGMGQHPSPICAVTKPFLFVNAGRAIPLIFFTVFGVIAVLTIVGNKLFCGWVCPLGAIQEVAYRIPLPKKLKVILPFKVTNLVRIAFFIGFVVVVFTVSKSIYDYFNPMEFFHWHFEGLAIAAFVVTLAAAAFIFRPFCYLVCPMGLFTWVFEHISIKRVRVIEEKCTDCNLCVDKAICPAIGPILRGSKSRPDCHACGECIEICPTDALKFK